MISHLQLMRGMLLKLKDSRPSQQLLRIRFWRTINHLRKQRLLWMENRKIKAWARTLYLKVKKSVSMSKWNRIIIFLAYFLKYLFWLQSRYYGQTPRIDWKKCWAILKADYLPLKLCEKTWATQASWGINKQTQVSKRFWLLCRSDVSFFKQEASLYEKENKKISKQLGQLMAQKEISDSNFLSTLGLQSKSHEEKLNSVIKSQ